MNSTFFFVGDTPVSVNVSRNMSSSISSVQSDGQVTISFSKSLYILNNITDIKTYESIQLNTVSSAG